MPMLYSKMVARGSHGGTKCGKHNSEIKVKDIAHEYSIALQVDLLSKDIQLQIMCKYINTPGYYTNLK